MRISIIIPSFNQAEFLEDTLRSVLDQDYEDKEILVLDGGSTDASVSIIKKYESRLAYWTSGPDGGQASAIAQGFSQATGDLVTWLNSDDVLLPGALARLAASAGKVGSPDAVFFGGHEVIDEKGAVMERVPGFQGPSWCIDRLGPGICQPGTFFGRNVLAQVGGLDTSLHYGMDLDLWIRFWKHPVRFIPVPGYLACFRRHSQQKGHTIEWLRIGTEEEQRIRRKYALAELGSREYRLARFCRRIAGILSGAHLVTLAFRFASRRTLREYHSSYS